MRFSTVIKSSLPLGLMFLGLLTCLLGCVWSRSSESSGSSKNEIQSLRAKFQKNSVDGALQRGVCPAGTRLNESPRVCVTRGGFALGPFPHELQELCREKSPRDAATCVQKQDWPFELLMSLYPDFVNGCPPGTAPGTGGICIGTDQLFGPFTLEQVMACRAGVPLVQQGQCDDLAWPPMFMKFVQKDSISPGLEMDAASGVSLPSPTLGMETSSQDALAQGAEAVPDTDLQNSSKDPGSSNSLKGSESDLARDDSVPQAQEKSTIEKPFIKAAQIPEAPRPPTFCVHSWDEVPGTADFTTLNVYLKSLRHPQHYQLDRKQDATLLGSRDFQSLDMCGRARFLKGCFQKVIYDNNSVASQAFRKWALGRVRPLEAYMAIVYQKTRLGLWRDECWQGECKGRGLARVDAVYSVTGKKIRNEDSTWLGVTHNIITNLRFGLRQIAKKLPSGPSDLYQLGFSMYQTPGRREQFARQITENYTKLMSCQLD